ncbi:acetyltransferase [Rhizobium sp. TRM95111]|uniref:GNAT family N-acetyltransferase n=1 Tax=Rhizobium alarense TaxID=2846851 RepID=UPI001F2196BF|nr:GNAT family N-acetyltransferase [Rhizobium alarense]MCF3642327.1 acetyltransferase [Rhizobium alarense]
MPIDLVRIGFRPVAAADYPLLSRWLEEPHICAWWGDPEEELGFIRDMVEGRDTTRPYLILLDGAPVGYIQAWFIGHHQNEDWTKDTPWLRELPSGTVGVDLSIGDASKLSVGLGSAALAAFVARLRREGHETIVIDPDPANTRAVRAYEKAGFRAMPALMGRTGGGVLIMQHDPKANEIS